MITTGNPKIMIKFLKTVELRGTSETSKVRPYAITVKLHSDKDFLPLSTCTMASLIFQY